MRVFILGAGATKAGFDQEGIPPPVDKDFFDIAHLIKGRGTQELARRVLKQVWDLYKKTSEVSLEYYFRDIEAREGICAVSKSIGQPFKWSMRLGDLTELIRRVYIQTTCKLKNNHLHSVQSKCHVKLLDNLKKGDVIITFNYDLVIEESFNKKNHNIWNPKFGYGVSGIGGLSGRWVKKWLGTTQTPDDFPECKVMLLKMHGSLNWLIHKYNKRIALKDRPLHVEKSRSGHPRPERISILPPGIAKDIADEPYSSIWSLARSSLEKCEALIIVGYSLPETDFMAHSLLNEVVRSRLSKKKPLYLDELYLVDPSREVLDKFIKLLTPILGPQGKLYKYDKFSEYCSKVRLG
ncbi:MAG: SIR2 family protein [Candidatus Omnitrophica bacterium]|nr:SIR2 family protein [Candidatus Omnitrophota bacterium]